MPTRKYVTCWLRRNNLFFFFWVAGFVVPSRLPPRRPRFDLPTDQSIHNQELTYVVIEAHIKSNQNN